ncbi:stress protein, partial [Pseudomonas aeruginosa]|uniref:TerD family protein n=1 Tax=Pseudomonas aeruginosa TaxID=287 RepID=UPI000B638744
GKKVGKVEHACGRSVNNSKGQGVGSFNVTGKGKQTGVVMGSLSRKGNDWDFKAIGQSTNGRTADDLVNLAIQAVRA